MSKPNIVFILMDDLGWVDLGCTGSTFYETPRIDALAASGMTFGQAYASCPGLLAVARELSDRALSGKAWV